MPFFRLVFNSTARSYRFCCLRVCNGFFAVCSLFCQPVPRAPTRCRHASKSVSRVRLTARLKKRALCCVCARTTTSELHWIRHPHHVHVRQSTSVWGESLCVHWMCTYLCTGIYLCVFSCLYNPILLIPGLILFTAGFSAANRDAMFVVCTVS